MTEETITESKGFVDDLRDISNLDLNLDSLADAAGLISDEAGTAMANFVNQIEASSASLGTNNADPVLTALSKVGNAALARIANDAASGNPVSESVFDLPEGVDMTFDKVEDDLGGATVTLRTQQTINGCAEGTPANPALCDVAVDVTLTIESEGIYTGSASPKNLSFGYPTQINLVGTFANDFVSLAINPAPANGDHISFANFSATINDAAVPNWKSAQNVLIRFGSLALNLPLAITDLGAANPITVAASVTGTVTSGNLRYVNLNDWNMDAPNVTTTSHALTVNTLTGLALSVDGDLTNTANSLALALDLTSNKTSTVAPTYTLVLTETCGATCKTTSELNLGDTPTDFLAVAASGTFEAILAGIADPINIAVEANRATNELIGLESLALTSGQVEYLLSGTFDDEGKIVDFDALSDSGLNLRFTTVNGVPTGEVVDAAGNVVATVSDGGEGKRLITYADGTTQEF